VPDHKQHIAKDRLATEVAIVSDIAPGHAAEQLSGVTNR
jgi:hypothetical protein